MKSTLRKFALATVLLSLPALAEPAYEYETEGESIAASVEMEADVASMLTCYQIISYCYSMWIIRRNNYPQYVGCVLNNAENNGLVCTP